MEVLALFFNLHLFTEVGRRHGRDCEHLCFLTKSDAGRGTQNHQQKMSPTLACLSAGTAWWACPQWGPTAGWPSAPARSKRLVVSASCSSWSQLSSTKCKVPLPTFSPEFFLCLWDQVPSSAILSNYFIFYRKECCPHSTLVPSHWLPILKAKG